MHVHGYVRVSHKDSAAKGVSIASQKQVVLDRFARIMDTDPRVEEGIICEDLVVSAWKSSLMTRPAGRELHSRPCRRSER